MDREGLSTFFSDVPVAVWSKGQIVEGCSSFLYKQEGMYESEQGI